jgi:DNA-binding transcriptional LysR family regulator
VSIYVTQSPIAMLQHRVPQYVELRERNVDLVFGPIVRRLADDDLETEILFREDLLVVTGSQNACNRRRRHALADLIDQPWCLPPLDSLVGMRCVEAFRASGLDLPRRMVTSVSMQLQMGLVTTQGYLTMFPGSLVRFAGRRFSIKALPIGLPVEPRLIGIITLKNRTISPVAQLFVRAVREAAKPIAKPKKRA